MSDYKTLQNKLFSEMTNRTLFEKANSYGLDYVKEAFDRNIFPTALALQNLAHFEEALPETSGDASQILELLHEHGSPATVAQIGGRYFGFVNGSMIPAGLAAKNLSIYWDQNTALQVISPIAARLESVVQQWFIDLFGLPSNTVAGFVSGTSMANFCGLAAARYRLLKNAGWDMTEKGLFGAPQLRVVCGRQVHSSILKAISLNGLGKANIEWVPVDDQGRILAAEIPPLDNRTILILQAGNVNTGSFDPFAAICKKARAAGAWIHVDGAFGLWAGATKKLAHLTKGYELAHSWAVDGHKTLNTPYDSGIILCCDEEALVASLHMKGSYIVLGDDRDGMFYTPEMSRRARIVELWATLKYLGREGVDALIWGLHERAKQFGKRLNETAGFEVLNEIVFNQVLVRCSDPALTLKTLEKIQTLRTCWVGGSEWEGTKVIRISVCSWATTEADVERSVASFKEALDFVLSSRLVRK